MRLSNQAAHHLLRPSHIPHRFIARFSTRPASNHLYHGRHALRPASLGSYPGARRCFSLETAANSAVDGAQACILGIHNLTHTPWYISIPLTAVTISLLFRLPGLAYTNHVLHTQEKLKPLYLAWYTRRYQQISRLPLPQKQKVIVERAARLQIHKQLTGVFGVQRWKVLIRPLLMLPVWVIAIEAIRRMCGGPRGLIGSFLMGPVDPVDVHGSVSQSTTHWLYPVVDQSLTTEGCLWFMDLTQPDPYCILPTAVMVLMVLNILPRSTAGIRALLNAPPDVNEPRKYSNLAMTTLIPNRGLRALQRGLLIVSPAIPFLLADLPSALTLYWAASAASGLAITSLMLRIKPASLSTKSKRFRTYEVPMIRPPRPDK